MYPFNGAQIHDYNPGNLGPDQPPGGVFWTRFMDRDAVTFDWANATATYRAKDLPVGDYTTFANGVLQTIPPTPAMCSFSMKWSGALKRYHNDNAAETFKGDFIQTNCTVQWSASQDGFQFISDPATTSASDLAFIGQEQNGKYY